MKEKEMRGVIALLALIIVLLLGRSLIRDRMERRNCGPEYLVLTEEESRERILSEIDRDPTLWIYDEDWGEYALGILETRNIYIVTGTVYNAVVEQCNSNPLVTADGSRIDKDKLNSGDLKWIAVSRDLLKRGLNYGDKVMISNIDHEDYSGIFEIHDTMNPRFTSCIDFLVPDHIKTGKWTDIIIEKIKE